jgi:DNA methylase
MARVAHAIIQAEARAWLAKNPAAAGSSVITSLPDASELRGLGFEGWRAWFVEAARDVLRWLPPAGVAIFYQSDIRHGGVCIDKGYLLMQAAEAERAPLLWHTIVCRKPPGTRATGRASYSRMLCFARDRDPLPGPWLGPDVLAAAGPTQWTRGMGRFACQLACEYLRDQTSTRLVLDPFCGRGSVLAVAAELGFDVIGVELHERRCRAARSLVEAALASSQPRP